MRLSRVLLLASQFCFLAACGAQAGQSGTVADSVGVGDGGASRSRANESSNGNDNNDENASTSEQGEPSDDDNVDESANPAEGNSGENPSSIDPDRGENEPVIPADAVNCDRRDVTCEASPPECPPLQVAEVVDQGDGTRCYGACLSITACFCEDFEDCRPETGEFTCRNDIKRCTPFLQ